jgi:hypothetical protein
MTRSTEYPFKRIPTPGTAAALIAEHGIEALRGVPLCSASELYGPGPTVYVSDRLIDKLVAEAAADEELGGDTRGFWRERLYGGDAPDAELVGWIYPDVMKTVAPDFKPAPADLTAARHAAADDEFESYDFGDAAVGQFDGWAYDSPGDRYDRVVWFTNPDDPDGDDIKGSFAVIFASNDSAEIVDAYGTIDGADIGHRPEKPASPKM